MKTPNEKLFRYQLAIAAIMKCEAPYLKEWLDYHLLAGVEHFYIYDNESPDNQAEIVQPYVEAGLVDYFPLRGRAMQYVAYNDALNRFRFQCRYMAFIDGDEFLLPRTNQSVVEVVDEILSTQKNAAGLVVFWQHFGSNGQETANYSRGVLERFTRRAPTNWKTDGAGNNGYKNICNPRLVSYIPNCHYLKFFHKLHAINELGNAIFGKTIYDLSVTRIALNHYFCKSQGEFLARAQRGAAMFPTGAKYTLTHFRHYDINAVEDDTILKYRDTRAESYQPPDNPREKISATTADALSGDCSFETLLVCLDNGLYLNSAEIVEQALNAIRALLEGEPSELDIRLFLKALPMILRQSDTFIDPAVKLIPDVMELAHVRGDWADYNFLNATRELLLSIKRR